MAAKSLQDTLLDNAFELQEEYSSILSRRADNREAIRNLATQGVFSDDQMAQIDELYPPRQSRTTVADMTPEQLAERAERRAQLAAERAAEARAALDS